MSLFRFKNNHGTLSLASKSLFREKDPIIKQYEPIFNCMKGDFITKNKKYEFVLNQMNCEYTVEQRSES